MPSPLLTALAAASLALAAPTAQWSVGQEVRTSSGVVRGHAAPWPVGSDVSEYLGIPFAVPPLGPLRFAPPKALISNATVVADKYGPDCLVAVDREAMAKAPQNPNLKGYHAGMGGITPHASSEDCLTVNVWTKPQTGEKAKAVLLWIYGGGFSSGASNTPYYTGSRLAGEQDVVVVTFNYRINIFGFPLAPALTDANPGLLDQRLAVEWVRDNIASFGGDPKRITIFGESAGGASVDFHAYAWADDPIVAGYIAQSGTARMGGRTTPRPAAELWYGVSAAVGCGDASVPNAAAASLECVRGKPAADVVKAVIKVSSGAVQTAFGPQADGRTVFADTGARAASGLFAKRPLLVGNTDNELSLNKAMAGVLGGAAPKGGKDTVGLPAGLPEAVANDAAFSCPAAQAAGYRRSAGVRSWRYRYMGEWENTSIGPGMGAYHSSEIPLVFGTTEIFNKEGIHGRDSGEEAGLSLVMRRAWAAFAKDPENGLGGLGWPVYDPASEYAPYCLVWWAVMGCGLMKAAASLVRLGYRNMSEPSFAPNADYDGRCAMIAKGMGGVR
ncbi:alpha/beta-hydrolase [Trichodelitschia bisporula]|uniref:Carboxylic ester hydrolase n=1 Tax=Trichodelitschia bisporula TaxID=703511 RepID=A0A6G1HJG6_9PEZI|nr:alpha/beta-hydrolase [Trichodelitschia bisporula]